MRFRHVRLDDDAVAIDDHRRIAGALNREPKIRVRLLVAADARQLDNLKDAVRAALAWGEIVRDKERLELRPSDQKLAEAKLTEVNDNAVERHRLLRCGVHHPLKLGATVIRRGSSGFDELGYHSDPLPLTIGA